MEELKPREDFLLKLDILKGEVARQVQNFRVVAHAARKRHGGDENIHASLDSLIIKSLNNMVLSMDCLCEEFKSFVKQ